MPIGTVTRLSWQCGQNNVLFRYETQEKILYAYNTFVKRAPPIAFYIGLTYLDPPIENGIAVNFGTMDFGSGEVQPTEPVRSEPREVESQPEPQEVAEPTQPEETVVEEAPVEEVLTSNEEEAIKLRQQEEAKRKAEEEAEKPKRKLSVLLVKT